MPTNYTTNLPNQPPSTPMPRQQAPYKYPGASADVFRAMNDSDVAAYNLNASQADANYALQQQEAARGLILGGLSQNAQAQQQQRDLSNGRLGILSSLLSNVYR